MCSMYDINAGKGVQEDPQDEMTGQGGSFRGSLMYRIGERSRVSVILVK